jgi:hypothetical protein
LAELLEISQAGGKGTIVIGGDALDGHHHFRAGLTAKGADKEIATNWIYKTDSKGNEVPMTREDKMRLWKASLSTKGVTTEDLAPGGLAKAEIQRSFRRFGKNRTRKDDKEGYAYRKEYVMALFNAHRAARKQQAGAKPAVAKAAPRKPAAAPKAASPNKYVAKDKRAQKRKN